MPLGRGLRSDGGTQKSGRGGQTEQPTHPVVARLNFVLLDGITPDPSIPSVPLVPPGALIRPVPVGSTSSCSKGFWTPILCDGSWGCIIDDMSGDDLEYPCEG